MRGISGFLALLCLCAATAHAQTGGGYVGVAPLVAYTDNARDFGEASFVDGSGERSGTGAKVYGGYLWHQFGIEVGYYDLGTYDVTSAGVKTDEFSVRALAFSGVFAAPLAARDVLLTAKLGLAFTESKYRCFSGCGFPFIDTNESGLAGVLGAGIAWRVAPSFSLRADVEYLGQVGHRAGNLEADYGYSVFSLGAQLNF